MVTPTSSTGTKDATVGTREALKELSEEAAKNAGQRHASDTRVVNRGKSTIRKPYMLMLGTHSEPNPDFKQGDQATGGLSHILRTPGEVCYLTDDQYHAFKNKFKPHDGAAPVKPDETKAAPETVA